MNPFSSRNRLFYRVSVCLHRLKRRCRWYFGGEKYLCGEIRSEKALPISYSAEEENHRFIRENGKIYRENELWQVGTDTETSEIVSKKLLFRNHVEVLYDVAGIPAPVIT